MEGYSESALVPDSNSRRRTFIKGIGGAGITGLAGCMGNTLGGDDTIKIGALAPNSGFLSIYGQENQRGYDFALNHLDNQILGNGVELVVRDTETSASGALQGARELVGRENVDALVGVTSSAGGPRVGQYLSDEGQVPLITSQVASANARQACHRYLFYPWPSNYQMSIANAKFIGNELGNHVDVDPSSVHYVGLDYEMGQSSLEVLGTELENEGSEISGNTMVPPDTTDFAPYFPEIEGTDADVISGFMPGQQAVQFVTQATDYGLKEDKVLCFLGDTVSILALGPMGEAANRMFSTFWYDVNRENELNVEYKDWYSSNFDDLPPNEAAANAANQLYSLAQGMEEAGSTNPDDVISALEGLTFESTYGEMKYRASDHQTEQNMIGLTIENNKHSKLTEYQSVISDSFCSFS